jgi:hypothetical protein
MQYDEAGELVRSSRPRRSWRARRPPAGSHEISFAAASGDPPSKIPSLPLVLVRQPGRACAPRATERYPVALPAAVRSGSERRPCRVAARDTARRDRRRCQGKCETDWPGLAVQGSNRICSCSSAPLDLRWRSTEVWREKSLCQTERLCRPCAVLTTPTSLSRMTRESPL